MKQAARNDNDGNEKELPIKSKRRDNERTVIRFDLSAIPPNVKVEKATVTFRVTTRDRRPVKIPFAFKNARFERVYFGERLGVEPQE